MTSEVLDQNATNEPSELSQILMTLTFNGFTYPNIEVGLDQRPRSVLDLLVNRDLMRQMNVAVNPNRTFVLSKRLRPIEKEGKHQTKLLLKRTRLTDVNCDITILKRNIIK